MLNPYYYKLDKKIFSEATENKLISIALSNPDLFVTYNQYNKDAYDNNWLLARGPLKEIEELQSVVKSSTLGCWPMLLRHSPNVTVPIHLDDQNQRNTVLITPLLPKVDYVSTNFYKGEEIVAVGDASDGMPILINTQAPHGLQNNDNLRLNLQLCFDEPFEFVRDLLIKGELFKL